MESDNGSLRHLQPGGFSRNLRKEITKSRRYYFYDNGIRNGLIGNFNSLSLRDDTGALWENYIMVERLKYNLYKGVLPRAVSGAPTTSRRSTWSRSGAGDCTRRR